MQHGTRGTTALAVTLIGIFGILSTGSGCGMEDSEGLESTPDGVVSLVQGALTAGAVDTFDDGDVSDWHDFSDAKSTVTHRTSSSRAQNGTLSMKATYALAAGGYGGLEKLFSTKPDWSGTGSLTFWVYGLGTGHPFTVQIYDAGNERWETTFKVDFTGWRQMVLPFANFSRSGFQPSSALVNGVRDLGGVKGMALIVAAGGQSGSVYIDAMAISTSTTASVPASSTPAPPPPATGPAGTIVPLYIYPDATSSNWNALFTAHAANPTVPIVAIVNPGLTATTAKADSNYQRAVARLLTAGIKVAGYVPTTYGARPIADVKANIDRWATYYPGTNAVFFDEQGNKLGQEAYYREIATYAKSRGMTMTIGNPGTDVPTSFMGVLDTMMIYESLGIPTAARVGGWHANYDRKNFGIIPYGCGEADLAFVAVAKPTVGWIYLQSDNMPDPWDTLPAYFGKLVAALK